MRALLRIGLLTSLGCVLALPMLVHASVSSSPIVQLVSYTDMYGLHVERMGWGSASVINNQGIIISNNHVVEDNTGNTASAFSVCVTRQAGQRPVCDYTASLIARDSSMDISILRIDPTDVHGKPVPYDQLQTIDIDFAYEPEVRDEVVIVGYPWVGANTITETKGIVGGITEYNDHRYIKTDATIAGGNSGGAMISPAGKLVGIPTFTMGGMMDSSLGYGLLIKEAQAFIEEHSATIPETDDTKVNFASVQKQLDTINTARVVQDPFVQFRFSSTYEINNYVPGQYIELRSASQKDTAVQALSISFLPALPHTDTKEFHHYLELLGVYDSDYERLQETTIAEKIFYSPISKNDPSNGAYNSYISYYAPAGTQGVIQIEVVAPLDTENSSLQEQVRKEVRTVLAGISFTPALEEATFTAPFALKKPALAVERMETDLSFPRLGVYVRLLNGLEEVVVLRVQKKDSYSGKGQTAADMYRSSTSSIANHLKALVEFQGMKGFIACSSNAYLSLDNFSTYDIPFHAIDTNLDGTPLPDMRMCALRLVEGLQDTDDNEYTVDILMSAPSARISAVIDQTYTLLQEQTTLGTTGTTNLKNPLDARISTQFQDVSEQSDAFKDSLSVLAAYGIIDQDKFFRPYQPMRWNGFLPLYLRMVYGIDLSQDAPQCEAINIRCQLEHVTISGVQGEVTPMSILARMGIDLDAYVPEEELYTFHQWFRLHLAGVPVGTMSERDLSIITRLDKSPDGSSMIPSQQLRTLDFMLYEGAPLTYDDGYMSSSFVPFRYFLQHPRIGLIEKEAYFDTPTNFNGAQTYYYRPLAEGQEDRAQRKQAAYTQVQSCTLSLACLQEYLLTMAQITQEEQEATQTYVVLGRGVAIEFLLRIMHLGFFDPELVETLR